MGHQIHLRGNESMQELRKLIKDNDFLGDIPTVGRGRKKTVIIREIKQRITDQQQRDSNNQVNKSLNQNNDKLRHEALSRFNALLSLQAYSDKFRKIQSIVQKILIFTCICSILFHKYFFATVIEIEKMRTTENGPGNIADFEFEDGPKLAKSIMCFQEGFDEERLYELVKYAVEDFAENYMHIFIRDKDNNNIYWREYNEYEDNISKYALIIFGNDYSKHYPNDHTFKQTTICYQVHFKLKYLLPWNNWILPRLSIEEDYETSIMDPSGNWINLNLQDLTHELNRQGVKDAHLSKRYH